MTNLRLSLFALLLCLGFPIAAAQDKTDHRQVYLGLIFHVRAAEMNKFVQSNRQYSVALQSHGISGPLLRWMAYTDEANYNSLWLYPIDHLNDIEDLSKAESQLDERITAEGWSAGSDLHDAVDHTEEFVILDELSLSHLPADLDAWTHQDCEFQLYYTSGGYGGSDSQVRELWRSYLSAFPQNSTRPYFRVLRVLIGLERPLWVVERCGTSWQQISDQQSEEAKLTGDRGKQALHSLLALVRKSEVWRYRFDAGMSYPLPSSPPSGSDPSPIH
jgi:hypothetical protein